MIAVRQLERPYTYEDLAEMPDDGRRYEVIGGELIVSPSPSTKHQRSSLRLTLLIGGFLAQSGSGELFVAPYDVILGTHDILEPDLLVILNDRLELISDANLTGPPDLVIEILSPSTRSMDRIRKVATYALHNVAEYWIVDPITESIEALTLIDGQYQPIPSDDGLIHSVRIEGLIVDPQEVFATPPQQMDRKS